MIPARTYGRSNCVHRGGHDVTWEPLPPRVEYNMNIFQYWRMHRTLRQEGFEMDSHNLIVPPNCSESIGQLYGGLLEGFTVVVEMPDRESLKTHSKKLRDICDRF